MRRVDDALLADAERGRWTAARARAWADERPWIFGCNFVPSTAVNQLEMWQAPTFDPATIDRELGYAADIGFNTVRVFLHDLLWLDDADGLLQRLDRFLDLVAAHGLQAMPVFFDGVWNSYAYLGPQPDPLPGVHNSRWVQSPHPKVVVDPPTWGPLRDYVQGVVAAHADDERVLLWDLYNEPGNEGLVDNAAGLTAAVFAWAREVAPSQPLTSPIWNTDELYAELNTLQLTASDVLSFHTYGDVAGLQALLDDLRGHERPLVCSEYLGRSFDSHLGEILPVLHRERVGALNWGLVRGRTQTTFPWFSPPGGQEPAVWFHDLLHADGTPHAPEEVELLRRLAPPRTGVAS